MKALLLSLSLLATHPAFASADDANAQAGSAPARACDSYIQQYCSGSSDHGPGCLQGHESDLSAACLEDMQKGPPSRGTAGEPAQGSGASNQAQ